MNLFELLTMLVVGSGFLIGCLFGALHFGPLGGMLGGFVGFVVVGGGCFTLLVAGEAIERLISSIKREKKLFPDRA